MSQAATPASTSGLVRVTVASGTRRVDLVLPGSVPVAELVPELARSVGVLDAATVYAGYVLGERWHQVGDYVGYLQYLVILGVLAALGWFIYMKLNRISKRK